jgi:hypothetical protein
MILKFFKIKLCAYLSSRLVLRSKTAEDAPLRLRLAKIFGGCLCACLSFLLITVTGCGYTTRPGLVAGRQKIYIANLNNNTYEHELEIKIRRAIIDKFNSDGNMKVVEENEAEVKLSGNIVSES